ncbi:Predicted dithiol-disulfide isomerase, DsbA family [Pedobacter westerhofensis]|uniref:Predicted dithiol-disulfide isomerase, DsbA family n=1 Tax=Pedobacter westerhofensis TaxID=425512 RepID=A0A521FIJ6_9SPHI|nr:DsbA family oxidoreductase [Pedobacter westerhofensis]SMO95919.1 Predicted dithiol-disulfide isomerase, DsbA family [Pedobacter westerhofensis]
MKVDIWSDVRCPFCYIGKRKFELALEKFAHKDNVVVEWHSFELDPEAETRPDLDPAEYLAQKKGQTREWAVQMNDHVSKVAAEVGLRFNIGNAVVANSFNAHRLIQLAKSMDLGNEIEELLFIAYFIDGKNIDDHTVLTEVGTAAGLEKFAVETMLSGFDFSNEVRADEHIAQQIGINGVPFFVFDQKLAVSGAQSPETFLGAMKEAWSKSDISIS